MDAEAFQIKASKFLGRKGITDHDLLSEMVLYYIEKGGRTSCKYAYLSGFDRLYPRYQIKGEKYRRHLSHAEFDESWMAVRDTEPNLKDEVLESIPSIGPYRAMLILKYIYGWKQEEIGHLFGYNQSNVSKMIGRRSLNAIVRDRDSDDLNFDDLTWSVQWIAW